MSDLDNETYDGVMIFSVVMVALVLGGVFYWFFVRDSVSPAALNRDNVRSTSRADFNQDGYVDYIDKKMLQDNLNCVAKAKCWKREVGKTYTGHNPIYVSDLDLDNNERIDQSDLDMVK